MHQTTKSPRANRKRTRKRRRARWIKNQLICSCGSRHFTIFRENVVRKVRTRHSHRRRHVAICRNKHKTRISFPTTPRRK
jgi:hypothetical protein